MEEGLACPDWAQGAPWYDPGSRHSLLEQALSWACYGDATRMARWRLPILEEGLARSDGYLPGVRWSPPGWQSSLEFTPKYAHALPDIPQAGFRLSVERFLVTLHEAYRPRPMQVEFFRGSSRLYDLSEHAWELRRSEQREWLAGLAAALAGRVERAS